MHDLRLEVPRATVPQEPIPALVASPRVPLDDLAEVYAALITSLRDHTAKTGPRAAVLGFSGGIGSGPTTCIAADAFGLRRLPV